MTFGATMARSATFSARCAIWLRFLSSWPWCEPAAPCATMRVKCTDTSGGARAIISTSTVGLPGGTRKPMRAGLVLLPARRAGGASRANGLLAHLDRQRALVRDHVAEVDQAELRVVLEPLHHVAGGNAEGA